MWRREFIKASLAGSAFGPANVRQWKKQEPSHRGEDAAKLAGFSLAQLRDLYWHYLLEDFLPFMDKYVIDHQYDGFMCNTDRNGVNLSGTKGT